MMNNPKRVIAWETSDGKLFADREEATYHETVTRLEAWCRAHDVVRHSEPAHAATTMLENRHDLWEILDAYVNPTVLELRNAARAVEEGQP